jgi:hypothetical protein
MIEKFTKIAYRIKNPPSVIEFGKCTWCKCQDKKWSRGRVVKVDGNICDIFYIDYGNTETMVPKSRLRDISDKYATIPDQALNCGLNNYAPVNGQWSLESTKLAKVLVCMKPIHS